MIVLLLASLTCAGFNVQLKQTYGFRPSQLDEAAQTVKSKQMDAIWSAVQNDPATLGPCLKTALQSTDDAWLRYDGSQLLVSIDHSPEAKAMLFDALQRVPMDDVDLRSWVHLASSFGVDGYDTSNLGRKWLAYPKPEYYLPEHGAYKIDRGIGALFIFGSMDEKYATPALIDISKSTTGDSQKIATWLLKQQATPEALSAAPLSHPQLIEPRKSPHNTREEFMSAFNALLSGNEKPFLTLMDAVPDGERDLVAVATADDLDTIRKVRRHYAAINNQHIVEFYDQFTQIILTMVLREMRAERAAAPTAPH